MTAFQTLALLLTFAALGGYINIRYLRLPATIGLMVVALLISMGAIALNYLGLVNLGATSAFVAHIDFTEVLLHGMLSFLLFAGALHIDIEELKKFRVIVITLATFGVVIATFVTGTLIWYVAGWFGLTFPYIYALLFGALVSPTDPVAVLGILKETNIAKNFRIKIGGESLLNDGVSVVMFITLLSISESHEPLKPAGILALLAWEGFGSAILGVTLGWITCRLLQTIDNYKVEVLLTLALVTGGYCLAEIVHVSAPITMVIAGLAVGSHGRIFSMSEVTRTHLDMFWELLDEILNAVLFMLIGLEMMVITITGIHMVIGVLAIAAVLVGRFISVSAPVSLLSLMRYRFEPGTVRMLTWGGLRGGISIAMALSLPPGPEKDLILAMTYIVVVFSILVQGTTFRHIVRSIVKENR